MEFGRVLVEVVRNGRGLFSLVLLARLSPSTPPGPLELDEEFNLLSRPRKPDPACGLVVCAMRLGGGVNE